jgi:hypothetical protein
MMKKVSTEVLVGFGMACLVPVVIGIIGLVAVSKYKPENKHGALDKNFISKKPSNPEGKRYIGMAGSAVQILSAAIGIYLYAY